MSFPRPVLGTSRLRFARRLAGCHLSTKRTTRTSDKAVAASVVVDDRNYYVQDTIACLDCDMTTKFTESHREPVGSSPPKLGDLRRFYGAFDPIILPGAAYGERCDGDRAAEYRSLADGRAPARETMAVHLKCL